MVRRQLALVAGLAAVLMVVATNTSSDRWTPSFYGPKLNGGKSSTDKISTQPYIMPRFQNYWAKDGKTNWRSKTDNLSLTKLNVWDYCTWKNTPITNTDQGIVINKKKTMTTIFFWNVIQKLFLILYSHWGRIISEFGFFFHVWFHDFFNFIFCQNELKNLSWNHTRIQIQMRLQKWLWPNVDDKGKNEAMHKNAHT